IDLEAAAVVLSARTTSFAAGAHLRLSWSEIALDDAYFARASTLSGASAWRSRAALPPEYVLDGLSIRPRLVALRGAHVGVLSLSDVDLRPCRFFGAHGLESLSIEASCIWPRTPQSRGFIDRETIAEEHYWRG